MDQSLSNTKQDLLRALEPWRVFGGLTYSVDTRKEQRTAAAERRRQERLERQRMIRERDSLQESSDVFRTLENEGVQKFEQSWTELLATVQSQLDSAAGATQ